MRLLLEVVVVGVWGIGADGEGGGGSVALQGAGAEVGEEAGAQGVAGVQALRSAQVAGNLRHTLPETQRQEVQRQSVGVKITCRERERGGQMW